VGTCGCWSYCPARASQLAGGAGSSKKEETKMRTLITVLLLMLAAVCFCPTLAADEAAKEEGAKGLAERLQDLHLTDEQEAKIADIRKECTPKVQEAAKELKAFVKEEVEKVHGVLTEEQVKKLETFKEERKEHRHEGLAARIARLKELDLTDGEIAKIQEIRKEYKPKVVKAMEGLHGILNDEQKKAREQALEAGKKRAEVVAALNLNDQQKEKVAEVAKDLATNVREEMEKIRDVLSEEQQAKLPELKEEVKERVRDRHACRIANLKELGLTEEQKAKIDDIRKEFRPKVHEAGNKLRAAIREEVGMIVAAIKG
jgi:Spy/CpxP family protein refolding chaperone